MSLGIPYMGSKRKLAGDILHFITSRHPGLTDFYDLFGGGGSVSFTAVKDYRFNVHYNELNSHIYHLVDYLKNNKTLEPKFYEWVTRENFFEQCARPDPDWYSGYVMSCWSFGNNSEKGYMYGADIVNYKRLAHEIIVNCCKKSMESLKINIEEIFKIQDIQKRRIVFCDYMGKNLQHLGYVEHLNRIQNLQNLQNLHITNTSYQYVKISGLNPVIYCDIPYLESESYKKKKGKNVNNYNEIETKVVNNIRFNKKGEPYNYTRRYPVKGQGQQNEFDHDAFYTWAEQCPCPVYISEYQTPFTEVMAFTHRSSLSATNNKKKTIEKIFWNGKGNVTQTQLF